MHFVHGSDIFISFSRDAGFPFVSLLPVVFDKVDHLQGFLIVIIVSLLVALILLS